MSSSLTKNEITILLQGLTKHNQVTRENYELVVGWANTAKVDGTLFDLIMRGHVEVHIDEDGELRFVITPLGRQQKTASPMGVD